MSQKLVRFYGYEGCENCRKARRFLESRGVAYEAFPIREQPPEEGELRQMRAVLGDWGKVCNRSGREYREEGLGALLPGLSDAEVVGRLRAQGNLVRRPFVLRGDGAGAVGFKVEEWEVLFPEAGGADRGTGEKGSI